MDARLRHEVLAALQVEAKKRRMAYTALLQVFVVERLLALGYELESDDEDAVPAVTLADPPASALSGGVADPLPAGAPVHVDEEVGVVSPSPAVSGRTEVNAPVEGAGPEEDLVAWLEGRS